MEIAGHSSPSHRFEVFTSYASLLDGTEYEIQIIGYKFDESE